MTIQNQVTTTSSKLDNFVLLSIDFSSYSGLAASDQDLTKKLGYEPETISSGEVKTVHRDHIKPFSRLRAKARSLALRYGTSFMGGYAIPVTHWGSIKKELDEVVVEFDHESKHFVRNYESFVHDWAMQRKPADADLIKAHAHSKEWVSKRFHASITACFLAPAPDMEQELNNKVKGMFDGICHELAVDARQAIKAYNKGSGFTTRILRTFENMTDKLDALSFIDPGVGALKKAIQDYLDNLNLPKTGKFEAQEQSRIALILSMMTNKDKIPELSKLLQIEVDKIENQNAPKPVEKTKDAKFESPKKDADTQNEDDDDIFFF